MRSIKAFLGLEPNPITKDDVAPAPLSVEQEADAHRALVRMSEAVSRAANRGVILRMQLADETLRVITGD